MSKKKSKEGICNWIRSWFFFMKVEVEVEVEVQRQPKSPEDAQVAKEVRVAKVGKKRIKTWVRPAVIVCSALYLVGVIVWFVIIERGYQSFEPPVGSTVIKVKGAGAARIKENDQLPALAPGGNQSIWDSPEYSIPPMENNAFFIITRSLITYNQTQDVCPTALADKLDCTQTDTSKCQNEPGSNDQSGFLTGQCVTSSEDATKKVCEIEAWCPVENSNSIEYTIDTDRVRNFTVFIKTVVLFSSANTIIRTVKDKGFNAFCRFNDKDEINRKCPIFSLGYIIDNIKLSNGSVNQEELFQKGGLILIEQDWNCNLDTQKGRENCFPAHRFRLLQGADDPVSPGVNFRFASKQLIHGKEYRTVTKVYGLRFVIVIIGRGGSFSIVRLSTTIQGNLAIIGLIVTVSAIILNLGDTFKEQRNKLIKMVTDKFCCCKSTTEDDNVEMMRSKYHKQDSQIATIPENIPVDTSTYVNEYRSSHHHRRSKTNQHIIVDDGESF